MMNLYKNIKNDTKLIYLYFFLVILLFIAGYLLN